MSKVQCCPKGQLELAKSTAGTGLLDSEFPLINNILNELLSQKKQEISLYGFK